MALLIMGATMVALIAGILIWDGADVRRQHREARAKEDAKRIDVSRR